MTPDVRAPNRNICIFIVILRSFFLFSHFCILPSFALCRPPALALPFSATNDIVLSRPVTRPRASFALIRQLPSYQPQLHQNPPKSFFWVALWYLLSFGRLSKWNSPAITCGNRKRGNPPRADRGKLAFVFLLFVKANRAFLIGDRNGPLGLRHPSQ